MCFSTYAWYAIRHHTWRAVREAWQVEGCQAVERTPDGLGEWVSAWETGEQQGIEASMNSLPERQREVLRLAYGLEGERPHSLADIGRMWEISRERVRQLRNDALVLLRLPAFSVGLRQVCYQNNRQAYLRAERLNRAWQRGVRR